MARSLDIILVVDLESTCWEGEPPAGEASDIIEIGLCPLEVETGKRLERRSILLRPTRSKVSAFCTELTTLRPQDVADGVSLADACGLLKREYQSKRRLWASWGDYDRRKLERDCQELGVGYPFGPSHLNVKTLFSLMTGLDGEVGMARALEMLGEEMDGTHHRGHDDAWNIAGILAEMLRQGRLQLG